MKKIVVLLGILILLGCEKKIKKPQNLIPKEKMANIIVDIFLFKTIITSSNAIENKNIIGKQFIYNKYNIDSIQLRESENYYLKKPKIYLNIYLKAEKKLEKLKDSINNKLEVNNKSE